jgi:hypothetical protein
VLGFTVDTLAAKKEVTFAVALAEYIKKVSITNRLREPLEPDRKGINTDVNSILLFSDANVGKTNESGCKRKH